MTWDRSVFHIPNDVLHMTTTLNTLITSLHLDSSDPIPLRNVHAAVMRKVLQWCTYHKNDPWSDEDGVGEGLLSRWDLQFFNEDQATVFELILAANYLGIKSLLDAACKYVAKLLAGKTPEQIRQMFNIKNDLTPEEQQKIRKENAWLEY
ncbi:unnamed protein product [Heligmosomoides polygyrus]|uniref:Skp1-related protein n=1 Tax=Heligmosomoides polygyrus TaxID=6339 RepID=A0A3P8CE96_HELPZ|nr:unnamed protein product [Heligmosomoides polygyrus]